MNLENLNVVELDAQEKVEKSGGDHPGNYWFDLYGYGNYPGAGWVHYNCGQAVNGPPFTDPGDCGTTLDASLNTGTQC